MANYAGFKSVELKRPRRSAFDLSHDDRKTSSFGRLLPVLVEECIPSDTFRGSTEILLRLAPLIAPIFDQIELYVHFFFVPNRLLWDEWEKFITGGRLGVGVDPVDAPIPPFFVVSDVGTGVSDDEFFGVNSLFNALGGPYFPGGVTGSPAWADVHIDMMPAAAYQCIWEHYYRDRNFVPDPEGDEKLPLPSGEVVNPEYWLQNRQRNWGHDYFHSTLPFTQRGEEVLMPIELGGKAYLWAHATSPGITTSGFVKGQEEPGAIAVGYGVEIDPTAAPPAGGLYVDGADFDSTSTSVNDFRTAYALQVWFERNALGGSRYTESTEAHFGVKPQDARLQRPEYIGGGRIPVRISEVISTSWATNSDDDSVPQANMAGHGVTYGNTNQFNYYCVEHGFIMGIASIVPAQSYVYGLPRMFRRRTFLDYPWPTFAKLGEQPVYDFELYGLDPVNMVPDTDGEFPIFGYQSRYADWKYHCSRSSGDFQTGLTMWHLSQVYSGTPVLSEAFNLIDPTELNRIFAVNDPLNNAGPFWLYIHNSVFVKRPLPYFSTPNTLGFE